MRRPSSARPRALAAAAVSAALAGAPVVVLLVASGAFATLPLTDPGCGAAVSTLLDRGAEVAPVFTPPEEDAQVVGADRVAVDKATRAVTALEEELDDATGFAADQTSVVSDLRLDRSYGTYDTSSSSAQSQVDAAQRSLESAESTVDLYEGYASDDADVGYLSALSDYYADELVDARADVAEARDDLTAAQAALATSAAQEASAEADAQAELDAATAASEAAERAADEVRGRLTAAQSHLDDVTEARADHRRARESAVSDAYEEHLEATGRHRVEAARVQDCGRNQLPDLAAATGLLVTAGVVGVRTWRSRR